MRGHAGYTGPMPTPGTHARLLALALNDAEAKVLSDALANKLGDDAGLEPTKKRVVERREQALPDAVPVPQDPVGRLPEHMIVFLTQRAWVAGPGCLVATQAVATATAGGAAARTAWTEATREVGLMLAAAVLDGEPGDAVRQLARLYAACAAEAAQAAADRPVHTSGEGAGEH